MWMVSFAASALNCSPRLQGEPPQVSSPSVKATIYVALVPNARTVCDQSDPA